MTAFKPSISSRKNYSLGITALLCCACTVLFIVLSGVISQSIGDTLKAVALKIIPSLFPFMVISGFMIESGAIKVYERLLGRATAKILHVSPAASGAVLLGLLSGFPVGAHTVCELYETGYLSKDEAENALCVAHNTGPGFLISVIGVTIWGNVYFGITLYIFQILSAVLLSFFLKGTPVPRETAFKVEKRSFTSAVVTSVSNAAASCVTMTSFIVFWKMISDCIGLLLDHFPLAGAAMTSFLEFSSGALRSACIGGITGTALCGFAVGFGGISSFTQAVFKAGQCGVSAKKCFIFKLFQGLLCALLCALSYAFIF